MVENLSGGTTNLLRMARSGCQSAVAFVALALGDQNFATATYPADLGDGPPSAAAVDNLVRQLWLEPGLAQGKALVRTVQLGGHHPGQPQARLAVAALPLGAAGGRQPSGILGVADPEAKSFGLPELELLSRIAQRLTSYVRARQAVRTQLATTEAGHEAAGIPDLQAAQAVLHVPEQHVREQQAVQHVHEQVREPQQVPEAPRVREPQQVPEPQQQSPDLAPPRGGAAREGTPSALDPLADPLAALLGSGEPVPGLVPLGALLGRAGRLLGAGTTGHGSLAVIVVAIEGVPQPDTDVVAGLVRSLRTDLRFDDPVASIGGLSFAAVVPLAPGGAGSDQVEAHLVERAREALASHAGAVVRAAHVVAPLSAGRDADELLRAAVVKLRAA